MDTLKKNKCLQLAYFTMLMPNINMFKYVNNIYFSKLFLTIYMSIYKIYWLHWIDLWINYKIVL
jgi:hypothetical protein